MRNKRLFIGIAVLFISFFGIIYLLRSEKISENSCNEIYSLKTIMELDGEFYLYLYKDKCPYCENIKNDIEIFSKNKDVYKINIELLSDYTVYDWKSHSRKYDKIVGEIKDNKIIFFNSQNEESIKKVYDPLNYKIVRTEESDIYGRSPYKIYAVSTHPVISGWNIYDNEFVIPGVPMLLKINEHKVNEYFYDDKEIIQFLKSNTNPVDKYWNLD